MSRLQAEWQRLYLPLPPTAAAVDAAAPLPLAGGRTRALVLSVATPGAWDAVLAAWQGVQADLQLPAPAIAVAGEAGYQLWFSLAEPVPADRAQAFLAGLRRRYLATVAPERVAGFPSQGAPAPLLPPQPLGPGRWSAFVATDLAALFADEAWLDLPPSADAQADLLSRVPVAPSADWQRACTRLAGEAEAPAAASASEPAPVRVDDHGATHDDPRRFLLGIMNDPAVDLRLRIEAAKALLPTGAAPRAC